MDKDKLKEYYENQINIKLYNLKLKCIDASSSDLLLLKEAVDDELFERGYYGESEN
jgi:hypothetical protein